MHVLCSMRIHSAQRKRSSLQTIMPYSAFELAANPMGENAVGFSDGEEWISLDAFPVVKSWIKKNRMKNRTTEEKRRRWYFKVGRFAMLFGTVCLSDGKSMVDRKSKLVRIRARSGLL